MGTRLRKVDIPAIVPVTSYVRLGKIHRPPAVSRLSPLYMWLNIQTPKGIDIGAAPAMKKGRCAATEFGSSYSLRSYLPNPTMPVCAL